MFKKFQILKGGVISSIFGSAIYTINNRNVFSTQNHEEMSDKIKFQKQADNKFKDDVVILNGNANPKLARDIASHLGVTLGDMTISRFADGECNIKINDSVRGKDVYIIQPTCPPVNENLMELLLTISTIKRSSAKNINVVIPYYGYSRQDRKVAPRVPISAADVARLLETVGVDRVIAVDLHCGQIQGFFGPNVPVDNLEANNVALKYFIEKDDLNLQDVVIVSPDAGGVTRAKKFQDQMRQYAHLDSNLAIIIKHREQPGKVSSMYLVGDVKNKDVIIIDDIIDTAGTLCHAVDQIKQYGARRVFAFATHALFSGNAVNNINNSKIDQIIITDTIPQNEKEIQSTKITRLSVAPLLAEAIRRIQGQESISYLFSQ